MQKFSADLACLTLSHIIDDQDAVEGYLAENPVTSACFPLLIRNLFLNSERNVNWPLDSGSRISLPDADTTRRYLTALWSGRDVYEKIVSAARLGTIYLIPYLYPELFAHDPYDYNGTFQALNTIVLSDDKYKLISKTLTSALFAAAANGHLEMVKLLIRLDAKPYTQEAGRLAQFAVVQAVENNHTEVVNYILKDAATLTEVYAAVEAMLRTNNFNMFNTVYPRFDILIGAVRRRINQNSPSAAVRLDTWISRTHLLP